MSDGQSGVRIDAKVLRWPQPISPEAQAVLRRMVGDDGVPLNSLHVMPSVDDHRAWFAVKAMVDRHYTAMAEALGATLSSQAETIDLEETTLHLATPAGATISDCAIIDIHGGAFVFGGGEACRVSARSQADSHGVRCYGVDYRMPPEHPYPAALDDCIATYRYVLDRHEASNIIVIGRSAGGNLAAAMLLRAKAEGHQFPAGLVLLSPEADLTESGDSFQTNQMADVVLPGSLKETIALYAAGADLTHAYLSPLFGDLCGFPPTFLQSGTRDLLLSNAVRMHRALRSVGVPADLHVFEAMPHGGFMGGTPEDEELVREVKQFVRQQFARGSVALGEAQRMPRVSAASDGEG